MPIKRPLVFEKPKTLERPTADVAPSPSDEGIFRAPVPGGWLILVKGLQPAMFFYPDLRHEWDGGSLNA